MLKFSNYPSKWQGKIYKVQSDGFIAITLYFLHEIKWFTYLFPIIV